MKTTKAILILSAALFLLFNPLSSKADPINTITYYLTSDHMTGGAGTPPFGSVVLNQNGTTVDVTVTLFDSNKFVKSGSADFMDFKFNAIGVALTDITIDAHTPSLAAATGSFNGDGTGFFAFGITGPSQANGGAGAFSAPIVFHVANATIADLTAPNALGNIFVVDMLSGQTGNTGPVDVSVPEPGILILLGIAMSAIGIAYPFIRKV